MKYEIHIGKAMDANNLSGIIPIQRIIITEEQFRIIEMFADQKKDKDLNTTYIINKCEFSVVPHFEFDGEELFPTT